MITPSAARHVRRRRVSPSRLLLVAVLAAVLALAIVRAEPSQPGGERQQGRQNSWSARSSTGRVLGGSWTGGVDPQTGNASGNWTLFDPNGRPVMRGGWSAAKSVKEWSGAWRANVVGGTGEFSGSWRASVDQNPGGSLADLFSLAVQKAVSGTFRVGANSGSWSIRVSPPN